MRKDNDIMYDDAVLDAFLEAQGRLFDERVADSREDAREFLEDVMACVYDSIEDLMAGLDEQMDISDYSEEDIREIDEVFDIGDGRYMIVWG